MDKAPDAFRTISEVADDLDIPAHVLRFWETRFAQIKPMKRSGGRRYYRPDDVDLLRGIRRLLYGEGYTIRGVQRILREHGIKAVQGLMDGTAIAPASFGGADSDAIKASRHPAAHDSGDDDYENGVDLAHDADADFDDKSADEDGEDAHPASARPDAVVRPAKPLTAAPFTAAPLSAGPIASSGAEAYAPPGLRKQPVPDRGKLQAALDDLIGARALIDRVLKDERQS